MNRFSIVFFFLLFTLFLSLQNGTKAQSSEVEKVIESSYTEWEELYRHLHSNPELSLQESNTSKRIAEELRNFGFDVTENIGGHGVVAVLENGEGPTVLVRSDMDALPIKEQTGVGFASSETAILDGQETPVMHACGHDMHMTAMIGTAKTLTEIKNDWSGTLILIAQPAEEIFAGSRAMINDGLFQRFPRPDYAFALHVNSALESGKTGITPGYAYASVDEIQILIKGRGGHGAYPELTIDPVVMASKLVLNLQTIITREISAFESVVLSIGAIQSGSSYNTVPESAELRMTLRTFNESIRKKILGRIQDMAEATGKAAGLPETEWPEVVIDEEPLPGVYNSPELSEMMFETFGKVLGEENVVELSPVMYGEDFGRYGRVASEIPILLYSIGAIDPNQMEMKRQGKIDNLPSTHSSRFLPDIEPTLKTGVLTMSSAVLRIMGNE